MRSLTGNQWSSRSIGVMWSYFLPSMISHEGQFWSRWCFWTRVIGSPYNNELDSYKLGELGLPHKKTLNQQTSPKKSVLKGYV